MPLDDILFSLKSPFRRTSRLRASVPALALFQFEVTPEYCVPQSIPLSDAQASRDSRYTDQTRGSKPKGLPRLRREIRRLWRQVGRLHETIWLRRVAVSIIIPFAGDAVSVPRSAALRRA